MERRMARQLVSTSPLGSSAPAMKNLQSDRLSPVLQDYLHRNHSQ
jgi:hypothetical protein